MTEDKVEWVETFDLLEAGNDSVSSDLTFGSYVTVSEELFKMMVTEINDSRIKNGNLAEGVDLIMVSEDENTESDV